MKDQRPNESDPLTKKEFNEIIEQAKILETIIPTPEDIVRYHSQATRFLLRTTAWNAPFEAQIMQVLNGGEIFMYSMLGCNQRYWGTIRDAEILYIFPPNELAQRLEQIEFTENQKVIAKADKVNKTWGEVNLKPKKKK